METSMRNLLFSMITSTVFSVVLATSVKAIPITVSGASGPWDVALNPNYPYGTPVGPTDGHLPPSVVDSLSGVNFIAGDPLTITSRTPGQATLLVDAGDNVWSDANGVVRWGPFGEGTPGLYVPGNQYLEELLGTFARDGVIVGSPFFIGNGPTTVVIPDGANELLMGVNDGWYVDNGGSVTVDITGPSVNGVPEACPTVLLLGLGMGGIALLRGMQANGFKRMQPQQQVRTPV
jgi:hypothetical protein